MATSAGAKRLVKVGGIGILVLFVVGFLFGAIFQGTEDAFLDKPKIQLQPEPVFTSDAEAMEEEGQLPANRFILTNTILSSSIATLLIIGLFLFATRGMKLAPRGLQNVMDGIVETMYNFVEGVAGNKNARKFFPMFATMFLFVVVNAWIGLVPIYQSLGFLEGSEMERHLLRPAGTDLNMPLALAIISFVFVEYWAIRTLGFRYLGKFFRFGSLVRVRSFPSLFQAMIDIFVGILELLSELVRMVSFTFRLFGNMTAGEILLLITAFLVPFVFVLPFYGLELLVGFIQALIFAGLTLVFVTIAIVPHEGEEH